MFGDLDWPLNASRGLVSISWASCFFQISPGSERPPKENFAYRWSSEFYRHDAFNYAQATANNMRNAITTIQWLNPTVASETYSIVCSMAVKTERERERETDRERQTETETETHTEKVQFSATVSWQVAGINLLGQSRSCLTGVALVGDTAVAIPRRYRLTPPAITTSIFCSIC